MNYKKIYSAANAVEAHMIQGLLEQESISTNLSGEGLSIATGGLPTDVIHVDHPQNPINPYGQTKVIFEQILSDYDNAYNLKYCSLRYFNAAGADPDGNIGEAHAPETHIIPLILDQAFNRAFGNEADIKPFQIYGNDYNTKDGTCIRDYIHVSDLSDIHIQSLKYLKKNNRSIILNCGYGKGYSVKEVVDITNKITGGSIKFEYGKRRLGDAENLVAAPGPVFIWINGGGDAHWITLKLKGRMSIDGTGSNSDAIGARVYISYSSPEDSNVHTQVQEVYAGGSYLSQDSIWLEFGLGSSSVVDEIRIRWPSGRYQVIKDTSADQIIEIIEPEAE